MYNTMGSIKLAYADMWSNFNPDDFFMIDILKKKFDIINDFDNPDFVICGPIGNDFIKYSCPRIQYLGEALAPDFNLYDYAIAFDYLNYGERYLRCPYFAVERNYPFAVLKHKRLEQDNLARKKFCNFIVSNGNGMSERECFFKRLNEYKHVDSAGRYLNNMPDGKAIENKLLFQSEYKFSLAFENSIQKGYITEKITQAWAAGTIPIYLGGNGIEEEFNPNAYIDVSKFDSYEDCIDYILYLDSNPDEYLKVAMEPIYNENHPNPHYEEQILGFFETVFSRPGIHLRNGYNTMWGTIYENRINQSFMSVKQRIKNGIKEYKIGDIINSLIKDSTR